MRDEGPRHSVTVTIAGEAHQIRTAAEPHHARRCAEYLDRAVAEARRSANPGDAYRAVILAALSITDELLRARESLEAEEARWAEAAQALERRIRERLGEGR